MTTEQNDVKEFMLKAEQECPAKPTIPTLAVRKLRIALIAEELIELADAFGLYVSITSSNVEIYESGLNPNLEFAIDSTVDLKVVVIGTDVAMGIDADPFWDEVHRSNMSKFIDGHKRDDGKWMKGKSYSPANLKPILEAQCF